MPHAHAPSPRDDNGSMRRLRTPHSHYRVALILSLPNLKISLSGRSILTTCRCSHYPINEISLPVVVLTNRSMDSHYRPPLSLGGAHGFGTMNPRIFVDVVPRLRPVVLFPSRGRASRLSENLHKKNAFSLDFLDFYS